MKPCRQSCTASVKSRNGSGREKNRKKGKKQMFHIKDKRWTRIEEESRAYTATLPHFKSFFAEAVLEEDVK